MQLVNRIINDGIAQRASDIHIEPNSGQKNVEIRYRVDGACTVYQTVPYSYRAAIVSRIKIMSNLDITERRLPQDGKIKFKRPNDDEIELRVATLPTAGNVEDVVLRILPEGRDAMHLEEMGMSPWNYQTSSSILEKPYGIILVRRSHGLRQDDDAPCGPPPDQHARQEDLDASRTPSKSPSTGSGRSRCNPRSASTSPRPLRAFLRADPDVIMVGEMRDFETAKIGVEASLTGHLVFTTLHTNSAPETIVRLLDMGIDPLNFADSLLGILAQRLCPDPLPRTASRPTRRTRTNTTTSRSRTGRSSSPSSTSPTRRTSSSTSPAAATTAIRRDTGGGWASMSFSSPRHGQAADRTEGKRRGTEERGRQRGDVDAAAGRHQESHRRRHGLRAGPAGLHQVSLRPQGLKERQTWFLRGLAAARFFHAPLSARIGHRPDWLGDVDGRSISVWIIPVIMPGRQPAPR